MRPHAAVHGSVSAAVVAKSMTEGEWVPSELLGLARTITPTNYLLSFDLLSTNFFVSRTRPRTCVHSETMLPTTCPHFDSESMWTYPDYIDLRDRNRSLDGLAACSI